MPRKSQADINTPRPDSGETPQLLLPCDHLPEPAKVIFAEIVASVGDGHLAQSDKPVLEALAVAIHVARELAAVVTRDGVETAEGKVSGAVRNLRAQQALIGQLSSRLRLTPQNRISKDKAATTTAHGSQSMAELYAWGNQS